MDEKGTQSETITKKPLTWVSSGAICRLVGVSEEGWRCRSYGKHMHRGWGERKHGHHWFRPGFGKKHEFHESGIVSRLLDLGLTKGCSFRVVQGSRLGPILVEVRGTRIALGHRIARRLIVEEIEVKPN